MRTLFTVLISLLTAISLSAHAEDAPNNALTLNTNAFLDQGALPVLYTCDGKDVSPQLDWTNIPAKTKALALVLTDPEAPKGTFYHWVVYNIPTNIKELPEDSKKLPAGVSVAKNSWGKQQYNGPCPPKGSAHTYVLTLYALGDKIPLPTGTDAKTVAKAIEKNAVGKVAITTVYSRWLQ